MSSHIAGVVIKATGGIGAARPPTTHTRGIGLNTKDYLPIAVFVGWSFGPVGCDRGRRAESRDGVAQKNLLLKTLKQKI